MLAYYYTAATILFGAAIPATGEALQSPIKEVSKPQALSTPRPTPFPTRRPTPAPTPKPTPKPTWQQAKDAGGSAWTCMTNGCNPFCSNTDCKGYWGPWGQCSKSCGGGTRTRHFIITRKKQCGGTQCKSAHGSQYDACNTQACPTPRPTPGKLSQAPPTPFQTRRPTQLPPTPRPTPFPTRRPTPKPSTCQRVDCVGRWGKWGKCSKRCGGGKKSRRYIVSTTSQCGGSQCSASAGKRQTKRCNTRRCPTPPPAPAPAPAPVPAPKLPTANPVSLVTADPLPPAAADPATADPLPPATTEPFTEVATRAPTDVVTLAPTAAQSVAPTAEPTVAPTTVAPTATTVAPTAPTEAPTEFPTEMPTTTLAPTEMPTTFTEASSVSVSTPCDTSAECGEGQTCGDEALCVEKDAEKGKSKANKKPKKKPKRRPSHIRGRNSEMDDADDVSDPGLSTTPPATASPTPAPTGEGPIEALGLQDEDEKPKGTSIFDHVPAALKSTGALAVYAVVASSGTIAAAVWMRRASSEGRFRAWMGHNKDASTTMIAKMASSYHPRAEGGGGDELDAPAVELWLDGVGSLCKEQKELAPQAAAAQMSADKVFSIIFDASLSPYPKTASGTQQAAAAAAAANDGGTLAGPPLATVYTV